MTYVETDVKKISGDPEMGYGVVFCLQDSDNFYQISIDTTGYYMMGKFTQDAFLILADWTWSGNLLTGFDTVNRIKVEFSNPRTFRVSFNDTFETDIADNNNPVFSGGKFGYIVAISPDEVFPDNPVDVWYNQIYP